MANELTQGSVVKTMLRFAVPMVLGGLLQQCYNVADTLIVGQFLGADALAAVGSAFSLMNFLTSILLGLAMGSGTVFSIRFGQKDQLGLKEGILASFALLSVVTIGINILVFIGIDWIIWILCTPANLVIMMREYLIVIFAGLIGIFLYNFFRIFIAIFGEFIGSAPFSGNFSYNEHNTGFVVCSRAKPWSSRSGRSNGYISICFRNWNCYIYANKVS